MSCKKTMPLGIDVAGLPYSPVVQLGDNFYFSGIIAVGPDNKPFGDFCGQLKRVFERLDQLLELSGLCRDDIFTMQVYLTDISNIGALNTAWNGFFKDCAVKPARLTIGIAALPFGCAVEIQPTAIKQV